MQDFRACNYFLWIDPPVDDQSRVVILGLLKRIKEIEIERDEDNRRLKMLKSVIFGLIVFVVVMIMGYGH